MKRIINYRGGNELAYTDIGRRDGFPVLVQHGLIASIDEGDLFDRLVALGARVISIARPGYGASSPYPLRNLAEWAEVVAVLVDALGLAQFDVLGISSGALYGYAVAYGQVDRVRNLFIFSGLPALYDAEVLAAWPYPSLAGKDIPYCQDLARRLFFSDLPRQAYLANDVKDSMAHDCFGVAQDLRLRFVDWGFTLADVGAHVYMRHSRTDEPFAAAVRTAQLLPRCTLEVVADGPHFSREALDEFIVHSMAPHYT